MAKRSELRPDILEVLWDQYCKVIKYQRISNQIAVTMTLDEYLSLWTRHRVATIQKYKDISDRALHAYLTGPFRPVCSWVHRDAFRPGGAMTVADAKIMSADASKKLFRFHAGDKHTPEACERIAAAKRGKKQTPEQIAKRTASRLATMAAKRELREGRRESSSIDGDCLNDSVDRLRSNFRNEQERAKSDNAKNDRRKPVNEHRRKRCVWPFLSQKRLHDLGVVRDFGHTTSRTRLTLSPGGPRVKPFGL